MGQGHYSSFILRLWVEPPDGVRWGVIQHVSTREQLRFKVLDPEAMPELIDFIRKHAGDEEITLPFVLGATEQQSTPEADGLDSSDREHPSPGSPAAETAQSTATSEPRVPRTRIQIRTKEQPPKP